MKSEPGSSAVDHETGKLRGGSLEEPCRQYHLQKLGDNQRLWLASHLIIPFTGIADYEKLAIQDVKNINKIYKPKTEAAKMSWREAVLIAQQLEPMGPKDRVQKCDWARLREIGGPALQKKLEYDNKKREEEENGAAGKTEGNGTQEKFKSPTSPRKGAEKEEQGRGRSDQMRRKDEMDYKMFRMSSIQKKSDDKKRKRQSSESSSGPEVSSPVKMTVSEPTTPVTTFNRSFKVKKEVKKEVPKEDSKEEADFASPSGAEEERAEAVAGTNGSSSRLTGGGSGDNGESGEEGRKAGEGGEEARAGEVARGGEVARAGEVARGGEVARAVHTDIETETAGEGLGEGTLVWAKMRVSLKLLNFSHPNA